MKTWNLKTLVITASFTMMALSLSTQAFAFAEVGASQVSCDKAKLDALVVADGNCMTFESNVANKRFGPCHSAQNKYRVALHYTCKITDVAYDFDTYH